MGSAAKNVEKSCKKAIKLSRGSWSQWAKNAPKWRFWAKRRNFSSATPLIKINFFWAKFFFPGFLMYRPSWIRSIFLIWPFLDLGPCPNTHPSREKHQSACKGRCQKPQSRSILIIGKPSEFFLGKTRDFVPTDLTCRRERKFMD